MEDENRVSALDQIKEQSAAGFVLHESGLCAELTEEERESVAVIEGKKGSYYYAPCLMSFRYAGIMVRVEENNYLDLAAETVRDDSRKYPRTTPFAIFSESPFSLDEETGEIILQKFEEDPEFEDLQKCRASNGALHLFSKQYLDPAQAEYLCEWHEVGRIENQ